jgi:hypothetical protein
LLILGAQAAVNVSFLSLLGVRTRPPVRY